MITIYQGMIRDDHNILGIIRADHNIQVGGAGISVYILYAYSILYLYLSTTVSNGHVRKF
jgi:hypothetical protein